MSSFVVEACQARRDGAYLVRYYDGPALRAAVSTDRIPPGKRITVSNGRAIPVEQAA